MDVDSLEAVNVDGSGTVEADKLETVGADGSKGTAFGSIPVDRFVERESAFSEVLDDVSCAYERVTSSDSAAPRISAQFVVDAIMVASVVDSHGTGVGQMGLLTIAASGCSSLASCKQGCSFPLLVSQQARASSDHPASCLHLPSHGSIKGEFLVATSLA